MTTIVYRDGVIAADTRSTIGDHIIPETDKKLYRLNDGSVVAGSGIAGLVLKMVEYLNGERANLPEWKGGKADVLHVLPDGAKRVYEGEGVWLPQNGPYYAIGSGANYAYGALAAGKSAREAVKIAAMFDCGTGLPVRTMRVVKGKR